MPKKPQIFISYARSDKVAVKNIYDKLANLNSIKPWMDVNEILGGEKWDTVIRRAIRDSQLFLLCLSRNSIQRRGVLQREVKIALDVLEDKLETDVFLIPTWIETGPVPQDDIPENLAEYEWVNLSDPPGWEKLIRSIEAQLKKLDLLAAGFEPASVACVPFSATDFNVDNFIEELKQALDEFNGTIVAAKCQVLLTHLRRADLALAERDAVRILRHLQRNNLFEYLGAIADALLVNGLQTPSVRSFYALSLLERGLIKAPLAILEDLTTDDPTERAEIGKLLGLTYTRIYLDGENTTHPRINDALRHAVECYLKVYNGDPKRYLLHGTSAAAILMRAERDGTTISGFSAPNEIAQAVLYELRDRQEFNESVTAYDNAAAVEACLALGRNDEAVTWAERLIDHEAADASTLRDLYRHLQYVWQLKPEEEPGKSVVPLLSQKIEVLQNAWQSAPARPQQAEPRREHETELKQLFGADPFYSLSWYKRGLEVANGVARIERLDGRGVGTGFVVAGKDLQPELGDELLFLTSAHVLTDEKTREHLPFVGLNPEEAKINFTTTGQPSYRVKEILWSSFTDQMDATLIRLDNPVSGIQPYRIAKQLPQLTGREHVYMIGHPMGGDVKFSLQDNYLLDRDETRLHYSTPSEPGSGGSPIFNDNWELLGIHHGGSDSLPRMNGHPGTYAANEGVSIFAIIDALKSAWLSKSNGVEAAEVLPKVMR
jgi:hypothetical protein